jgi:dihydroxyacetone kinase
MARDVVATNVDELGRLDAIAGDGDHGIGMLRGLDAAATFATSFAELGVEQLLAGAGEAWSEVAGGTSGALWGAALAAIGASLGDRATYTPDDVRAAVGSALARVQQLGKAELGDKTMVDALVPFDKTLGERLAAGDSLAVALNAAATAAEQGAAATAALTPRLGRARPLAERSKGHVDPGATSLSLIVRAIATEVTP